MSFVRCAILLLSLLLAGCNPAAQGTGDEQKEPYFLAARKRLQQRDVKGAVEYFEKALEGNPQNASAHIELGIIFENDLADWPGSLYHYSRALQIRPEYPSADVIRQHIEYCKRELAKSVVQLPSVEVLQRKVDALTAENQQLHQQLQAWQAYYSGRGASPQSNAPGATIVESPVAPVSNATPRNVPAGNAFPAPRIGSIGSRTESGVASVANSASRSHVVVSGETLERIARAYGIKVSALQAANPTIEARRLRPGQKLVIP